MRHFLGNFISVIFSFVKFSLMKLFYFKKFNFYFIERFSPNVTLSISGKSKLTLGKRVRVHSGTKICSVAGGNLKIGDDCRINYNCMVICRHNIEIASGVEIGPNVFIYDHDHDFRAENGIKAGKFKCAPVKIGKNTWIGANTVILKETTIGENCVIGAGSIVNGNIPDNTILVQKRETKLIEK